MAGFTAPKLVAVGLKKAAVRHRIQVDEIVCGTEAGADDGLVVTERIPCKPDPWTPVHLRVVGWSARFETAERSCAGSPHRLRAIKIQASDKFAALGRSACPLNAQPQIEDRKSTRLNSSHSQISHAV